LRATNNKEELLVEELIDECIFFYSVIAESLIEQEVSRHTVCSKQYQEIFVVLRGIAIMNSPSVSLLSDASKQRLAERLTPILEEILKEDGIPLEALILDLKLELDPTKLDPTKLDELKSRRFGLANDSASNAEAPILVASSNTLLSMGACVWRSSPPPPCVVCT
jgi:hypothetical protein